MARFGNVTSVVERPLGTTLALATSAGAVVITVDDISRLTWPGGNLRIGSEQHAYTVDAAPDQDVAVIDLDEDAEGADEVGTLTLTSALAGSYAVDEPVVQFQDSIVSERIATVLLPDQAEELVLRVPRHLWDRLPSGIRERDVDAESVALEDQEGEWVMTDVVAEGPSVDASFINTATLPVSQVKSPTAIVNLPGLSTEAWVNPTRGTASDNSWTTATGTSVTSPAPTPGNTGFKYPSTAADDPAVGSQNWDFPNAALGAPDDNGASATAPTGLNTHYLKLTDFGFSVPAGATITGVQAAVFRRNAATSGFGGSGGSGVAVQDNLVKLVKAGSVVGADHSNDVHWPGDFTGISYGSSSDLWGTTWTPAQINDSDFGIAISADANAGGEPRIDAVRVRVNYTTTVPSTEFRSFSHFLAASGFNFTIDDDATVTGITVQVERHASDNAGADYAIDNIVRLANPAGESSGNRATGARWPTTDVTATYGGDLWGMEWEPSDISDADFAVWFSVNVNFGVIASVDHISVTVHYVATGDA